MSQVLEASLANVGQVDWDAILDNAFQMGPYNRVTRVDDWTFVTGMEVNFPEVWSKAPAGSAKLFVLADTITFAGGGMQLVAGTSNILMGRVIAPKPGAYFFPEPPRNVRDWGLYFSVMAPDRSGIDKLSIREFRRDQPIPSMNYEWQRYKGYGSLSLQASLEPIPPSVPLGPCKDFLTRMHLAALALVNDQKPELAFQMFDKLQQLLSLFPGDIFTDLRVQAVASRELLQPLRPATDFVPYLSPDMYAGLVEKYVPALEAYAGTFTNFVNRTIDVSERQAAARLMLNREKNANKFQALVTTQLDENLRIANENVSKATTSMDSQQTAVTQAKTSFETGMQKWKEQKEREAAMAIASAAIGFISGIASIFAGNPGGAAAAANAAEQVEKAATTLQKLAEIMKKLVTIGKVIAKIAELAVAIQKAVKQMESAKDLANRMSQLTAATSDADIEGAPSAGAYWDQLWVELETQLAVPIKQEIDGANEYLKELKVLIIYGRALTTAQAALVPLMQEIARAALQAEIAKSQQKDIEGEIERLKPNQAVSAEAAAMLWIRYKTVQRSMLIALQNFDAAHRYWALSEAPPARDVNRPIVDMAGDLLEIANIKERQHAAFESFNPKPEDFTNVPYGVPQAAIDQFLKTGQFVLRFTSLNSPLSGWGRVGRVRVDEIFVWVDWKAGKRPPKGIVGFRVRSNGIYADQRLDRGGMKSFCFNANPVNFTFRYDLKDYSDEHRDSAIISHAAVAEKFRAAYSEPTLFTEWQLSLLTGDEGKGETVDRAALASTMSGITVKFTGTVIDDPGLLKKRARLAS
jgi:hypothetical protein